MLIHKLMFTLFTWHNFRQREKDLRQKSRKRKKVVILHKWKRYKCFCYNNFCTYLYFKQ